MSQKSYIYCADIYCEDCAKAIMARLLKESGKKLEDYEDGYTYDSDEFPKGPYEDEESDTPQHCACGSDCVNAITLSDGTKVGDWLENELTQDGVNYVKEAIEKGGEVADLWAEWYKDYL